MALMDIPKKKTTNLDPKFNVPPKGIKTPTGKVAIDAYQKSISPEGMAKANADAKKAIEKKYPGMFVPETRTTPGVKKK